MTDGVGGGGVNEGQLQRQTVSGGGLSKCKYS